MYFHTIDYNNTYAETRDTNPDEVHYIMEGFMGRYTYKLKRKSSGFWSKVGLAITAAAIVAAGIVGAFFTGGTSLMAAGAGLAAIISAASVTTALTVAGIAAASIVATTVLVAGA